MGHDHCVAYNDSSHGGAAIIPVATRVGLQVALVCLGECFSYSDKDWSAWQCNTGTKHV